jgi:hypothetical protein
MKNLKLESTDLDQRSDPFLSDFLGLAAGTAALASLGWFGPAGPPKGKGKVD